MPGKRELITQQGNEGLLSSLNDSMQSAPKRLWMIPAGIGAALVGVYAGFCIAAATSGAIAPHTVIAGADVSGLDRAEAAWTIGAALDELRRGSGVHAVNPDGSEALFFTYEQLGVTFDANGLAEDAYASSHSGSVLRDGWQLLTATLGGSTVVAPEPAPGWEEGAAEIIGDAADVPAEDFSYEATDDALYLTKETPGRTIDRMTLRDRLAEAEADETGSRTVELPAAVLPAAPGDLIALDALLGGEAANAKYDPETDSIVPERMALHFDVQQAQGLLDAAAPGTTLEIPTTASEPEVTAEELQKVLFRDLLGTYTTRVGGAPGRKANVKLTAQRVNGAVLNAGETFNYYDYCGPFSAANGYQSAPGYLHGKTVEMDGGGACQCSSTIYAAALLANLEIVARTAHGFASDYIGLGLDATVSGGGPDFIFRNNTLYPIKIETVYSANNRLTVNLYGTKTDHITVKMRTEVLSTTPFEEQIVEDPALAPGERVVEQTAYTGYVVNTYRQLYEDGKFISESLEARSKYNKRDRIVHVGPAAAEASTSTPVEQTPVEQTPAGQTAPADPAPVQTPEQSVPQPTPSEIPGGISPTPIDEQINQLAQQLEGGGA